MRRSYMLRVSVKMILSALASPRQFSFVFFKLRVLAQKTMPMEGGAPNELRFFNAARQTTRAGSSTTER